MKKLFILLLTITSSMVITLALLSNESIQSEPHEDCVPDEQTAIKIAEAIWYPLYGDLIYTEKPYYVKLEDGFWIVTGSLPETAYGGVAYIKFQKSDCKVVEVYHSK